MLGLHRCLLRIVPLGSEKKTWPDENQCSSPVEPTTTRVFLLPGASFSTVMVKKGSVPLMANLKAIFHSSLDEHRTEFWWKYSQDTALQDFQDKTHFLTSELVHCSSKLPFAALHDWPRPSRMREEYMCRR